MKKRRRSNVVEKFREVSDTIWVSLNCMIVEKTLKEESSQNIHYNDNYNYNSAQLLNFNFTIFYVPSFIGLKTISIKIWHCFFMLPLLLDSCNVRIVFEANIQ